MTIRPVSRAMLCCLLLASACVQVPVGSSASATAAAGETPFTFAGTGEAAIVVPVRLNGKGPYDFVLDTGATLTCVDVALARELDLPAARGVVGRGATIGSSGGVEVHRLDTLAVADATVTDLMACALDLQHIRGAGLDVDGLLGLNVLKQYTVTLDFQRRMLRLEPGEPSGD